MKRRSEQTYNPLKIPIWRSLRFKIALSYIGLILFVLILLNTYPIFVAQDMVIRAKQTSLQNQASVIAAALSPLEDLTEDGVEQVMDMLDDNGLTRVIVTKRDGLVLYDTEESDGGPQYALMQELVLALRGRDVFVCSYSAGAFRSSAAVPILYRRYLSV